jgi:hypothetical protein
MSNLTILGHKSSKELIAFKNDFENNTGIKVVGLIESKNYFHWKRLVLEKLDCDEMIKISNYIVKRFSTPGIYTHLSVQLSTFDNNLCLTVDVEYIKKFILK